MEEVRRFREAPAFQFNGQIVSAILYYKGNTDLIHSWDIVLRGVNLSKSTPEERLQHGFTDEDMEKMNAKVRSHVDYIEGRA